MYLGRGCSGWNEIRCASLAWHDVGYPGQMALLNHKDPKVVNRFLETFQNDCAAIAWAALQSPTGADFARRNMLSGPIMKQLAPHLHYTFEQLPADVQKWGADFWSGLLETVCSERANKVLRECATRDCNSKVVARTKRWEALVNSKLADVYKRPRLQVEQFKPIPDDVHSLLESMYTHVDPKPPLAFKRILGDQDWDTFNSVSIRSLYAETILLRDAFRLKDPTIFTESWRTAFIPPGYERITCNDMKTKTKLQSIH